MSFIGDLKDLAGLLQKVDNADAYRKFITVQTEAMGLQDEVRTLRERVKELEEQLHTAGQLVHAQNAYWQARADGTLDGPFSMCGWDRDKKLIRCHHFQHVTGTHGPYHEWKDANAEYLRVSSEWTRSHGVFPDGTEPPLYTGGRVGLV